MTLKDKLPDRLKCSPLLTMESDSDIETIAESIVNLSDSDGDFFKKTEKLLLMACLGYLRDWCEPSQRTIGNLISLLDAALPKDNETHTTLDNLFYEMKSGCKRVKSEDGITTLWEPSALSRCDGLTPRDSNGIDVSEDFSLTCYEGFRHAATRETRTSIACGHLEVLVVHQGEVLVGGKSPAVGGLHAVGVALELAGHPRPAVICLLGAKAP